MNLQSISAKKRKRGAKAHHANRSTERSNAKVSGNKDTRPILMNRKSILSLVILLLEMCVLIQTNVVNFVCSLSSSNCEVLTCCSYDVPFARPKLSTPTTDCVDNAIGWKCALNALWYTTELTDEISWYWLQRCYYHKITHQQPGILHTTNFDIEQTKKV